jgi:hypothetical protein
VNRSEPTLCDECGHPHRLTDEDAGTDREMARMCVHCWGLKRPVPKPNKRLPSAGRWEDSQQGMRAARDDWANKNRG